MLFFRRFVFERKRDVEFCVDVFLRCEVDNVFYEFDDSFCDSKIEIGVLYMECGVVGLLVEWYEDSVLFFFRNVYIVVFDGKC